MTDSPTSKSTATGAWFCLLTGLPCSACSSSKTGGEHGEDLIEPQRDGVVGVAHEAGDTRRVANGAPGSVGQVHADKDIAGNAHAVDDLALRVLDLDDLFHGHLDLEDVIFHVQGLDAGLKVGLHAVFVSGVGVDDVPVTFLAAQLALEFFSRIGRRCSSSGCQVVAVGLFLVACSVVRRVIRLGVHVSFEVLFGIVGVGRFGRSGINLGLFHSLSCGASVSSSSVSFTSSSCSDTWSPASSLPNMPI